LFLLIFYGIPISLIGGNCCSQNTIGLPLSSVRLLGVEPGLYVSNTIAGHSAKYLRHKLFFVVRVYKLGYFILMENFGLEEFYNLGAYCMSHRFQPDKFREVVMAYKNHRTPSFGSRIWSHKVDEHPLASPFRDSLFSH